MVLLGVVTFDDWALEAGSLVDQCGAIVTLQAAGDVTTLVRVQKPVSARRRLGFGGSRKSRRERIVTGRLGLGGHPPPLLLLGGRGLSRTVLLVVVGGRDVVNIALTIRFRAIAAAGRGSGLEGGRKAALALSGVGGTCGES
jgi:hypothetical protein